MNNIEQHLKELEAKSIYIIREAYAKVDPLGMLWSIGKDSTTLLYLVRKAFFGKVPFPLIHLDTDMEMDEVYEFRSWIAKEWDFELTIEQCPPEDQMDPTLPPASRAAARKTEGLKNLIRDKAFKGIFLGIRRDEQSMRAKERVFSPRVETGQWNFKDQPAEFWEQYKTDIPEGAHLRIHPLLHWTELDIWRYTKMENIPYVPLYLSQNGKRYRSLGEKNITFPIDSDAATLDDIIAELEATREPERAGRAMDNETEDAFERLRSSGYM
tara:strand:- start:1044 stop:1850 length:807 start_codon:yes stop_codon:yes gene_type:complete